MTDQIEPALDLGAFNCPRCNVFAKQEWYYLVGASKQDGMGRQYQNGRKSKSRNAIAVVSRLSGMVKRWFTHYTQLQSERTLIFQRHKSGL